MARKLVTLRTITNIRRMKGQRSKMYDIATLSDGWLSVVRHGSFDAGQLVFYFEIDSFIPTSTGMFSWEENQYMVEYQGQMGYHVHSQMIDKQLSQGMVKSIASLPQLKSVLDQLEHDHGLNEAKHIALGMAFEEHLGVIKWEVPLEIQGQILSSVPQFFPRAAWERVQDDSAIFTSKHLDTHFQVTEKLDGASMTVYRVRVGSKWQKSLPTLPEGSRQQNSLGRVGVASAGKDLDERGNDLYWQAARRVGLPDKLYHMALNKIANIAIQGELIGPSIKNNSLHLPEDADHEFIVYHIFNIDQQKYLHAAEVVHICEKMELPHVPVIGYMKLREFATSVDEILAKAEGVGVYGQAREGLVLKSLRDNNFGFKVISNLWLLEQGE